MKDHCRVKVNELPLDSQLLMRTLLRPREGNVRSKAEAARKKKIPLSELTAGIIQKMTRTLATEGKVKRRKGKKRYAIDQRSY